MTDLMIILGSPASGKSTLARRMARELRAPCLCKDDVKEALFDILGALDRTASKRLSDASFAALLRIARTQLQAGVSCIVEGNWHHLHAAGVRGILAAEQARSAQVWCRASPAQIVQRFKSRTRHAGHLDAGLAQDELERWSEAPPGFLDVAGPRWVYDSGEASAYGELIRAVESWRL